MPSNFVLRAACVSALLPAFLTCACQDRFPSNEQMRHFQSVADPRLSPDGKQVLVRITESTADGGKSHLWLIDVAGGAPRQLTYSPYGDKRGESRGEWMPDGQSILFTAHRGEHTTLYRLPMAGGEAKAFDLKVLPVVDESKLPNAIPPAAKAADDKAAKVVEEKAEPIEIDVAGYRVAPSGKTAAVLAEDPQTPGEKKQKDAKADAAWVDHDPHGTRLYLLDIDSGKMTLSAVTPDVRGVAWSPDSAKLVALADGQNGLSDLGPAMTSWLVTTGDPEHPAKLTDLPPTIESAGWSADGLSILYLAQAKQDAPPGVSDLFEYTVSAKATRNITDGFDGTMGRQQPVALPGGGFVELVEKGVDEPVMRFDKGSKSPQVLSMPVAAVSAAVTNDQQNGWVFLGSSGGHPEALYYSAKLTDAVHPLVLPALTPAGLMPVSPKRIQWKSDQFTVQGLLYLPEEAKTRKVPLIVEVHGGPLGAYLDSYSAFTDFLLGHGWAVLRTNPRGSTGRGAAFAAANKNDLGGGDYRDVMAGVDFVLKTEAIDPDRLALMGYSYGGEMAGFVEGKTTRFKAIVSGAPVIDQFSEYGTESGSWYDRWYFGKPWERQADAWRQSPLSGVAKAKTPFLLLQGESDTTDPLGQSQEMYRALRQAGVAVDLVTYPRDNHGPLANALYGNPTNEPWHGFDARQRVVAFFQKAFGTESK